MSELPALSNPPAMRRLALFLDGTWNAVGDNTNVWRLRSLCAAASPDGARQVTYYDVGVNGFVGGMVGKGVAANVSDAYKWLVDEYNPRDEIFIFGFSRGAYMARSLAGFIAKYGLLTPGSPLSVNQLYNRYRRAADKTIRKLLDEHKAGTLADPTLEERWMLKYSQAIPIKFIGVWDTVGALGVPFGNIRGVSRTTLGFLHTGLRLPIENGFHAVAVDEHRKDFAPTLWTARRFKDPTVPTAVPRSIESVEQRWFAGAHANVGGGCESDLLAQVPLMWIARKAARHGLAFRKEIEIDGEVVQAPISDSYKEFMRGAYSKVFGRHYRPIAGQPQEDEESTHPTVNETIDGSVFERWRALPDYRPPNLRDWGKRHGVDPAMLTQSVMADNPRVAAPD